MQVRGQMSDCRGKNLNDSVLLLIAEEFHLCNLTSNL